MPAKEPCPKCGSSDNLNRWPDGHAFCFTPGCGHYEPPGGATTNTKRSTKVSDKDLILGGEYAALPARKLTQATCEKWHYQISTTADGRSVQVANYLVNGAVVGQKVRGKGKEFFTTGRFKEVPLYGQWLWGQGGRRVVVTEGEIDAMTVSQLQDHKWPVVSVPNGAAGAAKALARELEWLESFDEVVLMFDNDDAGRAALEECAPLFMPGKCKIATLPLKDANDMLKEGRGGEIIKAIWDAKVYRPDGIIDGRDITIEFLKEKPVFGYSTQYPQLDELLGGIRKGEVTLFTAGTGVGKSTIVRHIGHWFGRTHGLRTFNVFLEESFKKTTQGLLAIDHKVPLGELRRNPDILTDAQYESTMRELVWNGRTFFLNHFGSLDSKVLLSRMNYMAVSEKVDFILLDHISIVVSGMDSSQEGERKDIDKLMTSLRTLVERTGVGVICIAHLAKADGKSHEEGGRVALNDLRGSAALKQIPDNIIALERDQQGSDANLTTIRVLKNREFGDTGIAGYVKYDRKTGLLLPTDAVADDFPPDEDEDEPTRY